MTIVGCDLHTRKQQVAVLHTDTGEVVEQELLHAGDAVEQFYRTLPRPVTVGIESTGYALWFHELMQHLGHTLLVGEAAKIRAMVVRKTKTDRRDAQHLLDLLKDDQLDLRRLLDGQVGGFGALQDLIDEDGNTPLRVLERPRKWPDSWLRTNRGCCSPYGHRNPIRIP